MNELQAKTLTSTAEKAKRLALDIEDVTKSIYLALWGDAPDRPNMCEPCNPVPATPMNITDDAIDSMDVTFSRLLNIRDHIL